MNKKCFLLLGDRSKSVLIALLLLIPLAGNASHIVGGELNYSCLGNSQYEITLTVYRDCFYGLADFDDPASIGIFDGNGFYVDSLFLPRTAVDTLMPLLSDTCLFVPGDVCVSTTTYSRIVTLPNRNGGYILSYQRCCRNQTINNILSPDNTGATFMVRISQRALNECNKSAKFDAWPPIFICVNEPIFFSQAATDEDQQDSIVYKLCTPLAAGDSLNNRPQPPLPPPYDNVVYNSPTYGIDNVFGFGEPLKIDPKTGILTGKPTVKGQFVVGICIEEYRNGQLLSTTRRDFQYNVGDCGVTRSSFNIPSLQCENLTVNFENQSVNAENFIWFFNDPGNPGASSTDLNPSYTYSDTGRYQIMLVTEPGSECSDTSFREIYLKNSTVSAAFEYENQQCNVDSITLQFTDTSTDSYSTPQSWQWELSDGQTSNERDPVFLIAASQDLTVQLTVVSDDQCSGVTEQTLDINLTDLPPFGLPGDTLVCGNDFTLTAGNQPTVSYTWASDAQFNEVLSQNGNITITPDGPETYYIRAVNTIGCERLDSIQIDGNIIDVTLEGFDYLCLNEVQNARVTNLDADDNLNYQWSPLTDIIAGANSATPSFQAQTLGNRNVQLTVTDASGCQIQESFSYMVLDTNVPQPFTSSQNCEGLEVEFEYDGTNLEYYSWDFGDNTTATGEKVSHSYAAPGTYRVRLVPEAGLPCSLPTLEKELTVYENLRILDFDWSYQNCRNDAILTFDNLSQNFQGEVSSYRWEFSNGVTSNQISPTILVATSQQLQVTLTMRTTEGCTSTLNRTIDVDVVEISLPSSIINCESNPVTLNPGGNTSYEYTWSPAAGLDRTDVASPVATPNANTTYSVTVTNGTCQITEAAVTLLVSDVTTTAFSDSIIVCGNAGVELNPNGPLNPNFEYQWTPTQGLSNPNIANPIANPQESTVYTAVIRDLTNDCQVSRGTKAVVPDIPLAAGIDFEYENCLDSAVVALKDVSQNSRGFILDWDWKLSNGMESDQRNPVFTFAQSGSVDVTLTVRNVDGCIDSRTTPIEVQLLEVNTPDSITLCIGESAALNPNANPAYDYKWFPTNSLSSATAPNPTASPKKTTEYSVTITSDVLQCQGTQTVKAIVPAYQTELDFDWSYLSCSEEATLQFEDLSSNSDLPIVARNWSFSTGETSTELFPQINLQESGAVAVDLAITLSDGCSFRLPTQTLEVELIDFNPADSLFTCLGKAAVLNANGDPDLNYQWSPAEGLSSTKVKSPAARPSSTTVYTVVASTSSAHGQCAVEREIKVVVPDPINVALNTMDTSTCASSVVLNVTAENDYSLMWSDRQNFSNIMGTGSSLEVQPGFSEVYYLRATDDFGCFVTDSARVTSYALQYDIENQVEACFGDTSRLSITQLNALDPLSFRWSPDLEIIEGESTASVLVSPLESTLYTVFIENEFGCKATETVNYQIVDLTDQLTISATPNTIIPGGQVSLSVTEGPGYKYTWVPTTEVSNPAVANPTARPKETTTFAVLIEDQNGCIGRKAITVEVLDARCEEPFIFVPKGFTPNDDGRNDALFVRGNPIAEMHFAIYNRWGEKVFETNDKNEGWDGRYKGKLLSADVYGYYVRVICIGGEEFFKKGNITLIR